MKQFIELRKGDSLYTVFHGKGVSFKIDEVKAVEFDGDKTIIKTDKMLVKTTSLNKEEINNDMFVTANHNRAIKHLEKMKEKALAHLEDVVKAYEEAIKCPVQADR